MPVVDVSVLSASEVVGVSLKKSFNVYVRLQGQAIRTKPASADRTNEIRFGERFRFQFQPDPRRPGRNRMFVELWTKSLFSQGCVSVAWIDMDQQEFVRGQPTRLNVRGTFEGKSSTISLVFTALDFGTMPGGGQQQPQQQQLSQQGQMQYPPQQQQPPPQAMYNNGPAEGVPLAQQNPYSTASYVPNAVPYVQDPSNPSCRQCEAAPLPPQPDAFFGASLPPPLYPGLAQSSPQPGNEQYYPEALPVGDQNPKYDYGDDYPKKPKQL